MINKVNQILKNKRHPGGGGRAVRRDGEKSPEKNQTPDAAGKCSIPEENPASAEAGKCKIPEKHPASAEAGKCKIPENGSKTKRGSGEWIPFASYCTTGQFMKLQNGYIRHCGPTAAVNIARTLQKSEGADRNRTGQISSGEELFLLFAEIGRKTHIYWNKEILGHFGGTANFLTGYYLHRCLRAAGLDRGVSIRFHPWITPDAVKKALEQGAIVLLQVYFHPKYKSHQMLCYACETDPVDGKDLFLLADGWTRGPVLVDAQKIGYGHFLTIRKKN